MCGPERTDLAGREDYCGRFMTPSLRNVATRRVFFHNGVIHSLNEAVAFYANRDTLPNKFDDLPQKYRNNIEMEPPFGPTTDGRPVLTEQDINAIVAFLKTLNDGWTSD
jgi:cytochrome c peroxidase